MYRDGKTERQRKAGTLWFLNTIRNKVLRMQTDRKTEEQRQRNTESQAYCLSLHKQKKYFKNAKRQKDGGRETERYRKKAYCGSLHNQITVFKDVKRQKDRERERERDRERETKR
jgi:hypothetical protein